MPLRVNGLLGYHCTAVVQITREHFIEWEDNTYLNQFFLILVKLKLNLKDKKRIVLVYLPAYYHAIQSQGFVSCIII